MASSVYQKQLWWRTNCILKGVSKCDCQFENVYNSQWCSCLFYKLFIHFRLIMTVYFRIPPCKVHILNHWNCCNIYPFYVWPMAANCWVLNMFIADCTVRVHVNTTVLHELGRRNCFKILNRKVSTCRYAITLYNIIGICVKCPVKHKICVKYSLQWPEVFKRVNCNSEFIRSHLLMQLHFSRAGK